MSDAKLLKPDGIQAMAGMELADLKMSNDDDILEVIGRSYTTIIALAERLARVERCSAPGCIDGYVPLINNASGCGEPCPACDGTGLAHKDAMDALRALGEG